MDDKKKAALAAEKEKQRVAKEKEKEKAAKAKAAEKAKKEKEKAKADLAAAKAKEKELKAKEKAAAKAAKPPKAAKVVLDPDWIEQLDERGQPELIDKNKFPIEITCCVPDCGQIRYVNNSGVKNVIMCKPHARKERRKRRMAIFKAKQKGYKEIVAEALAAGLFPDKFKKKYGLA